MNTIGSRLTALHLAAVSLTVVGILLLGRYMLETRLIDSLDRSLERYFLQLKDRLGTDVKPDDVASLLAASGIEGTLNVEVEDLWNDPAYRAARSSGAPTPDWGPMRFRTITGHEGKMSRLAEGVSESIKIRLSLPIGPVRQALEDYTRVGGAITAVVLLLSCGVGPLLSRLALRPVRLIERTASRITSDNLSERIPVGAVQDEISNLARLLNKTFDRLQSSFEQIKQFSGDASHELKTPLSLLRLNIERIVLGEHLSSEGRLSMQESIEEIDRLTRLVERLLFLSRAEAGEVELGKVMSDPHILVESFAHDALALAEARGVTFVEAENAEGLALFDPERIRQVLLNLLSNALDATSPGGRIELRSEFLPTAWRVSLADDGVGLPPEKCEVIFNRFVRAHGTGHAPVNDSGAGLGLAICRTIIELHGGRIRAQSNHPNPGVTLMFDIPLQKTRSGVKVS